MRINLRRRDAGVAEHLLHRAQVAGGLQHMGCERMAQHVRMHDKPQLPAEARKSRFNDARGNAPAACADEQRRFIGTGELRADLQPACDGVHGLRSHRHAACLAALAGDGDFTIGVDLPPRRHVQADEFGQAQPGRVEQFEHGAITDVQRFGRVFVRKRVEQARSEVGRQRVGQALGALRCAHAGGRIDAESVMARQPVEQSAPGRQHARDGRPGQAATVQRADGAPHVRVLQLLQGRLASLFEQ